MLQKESLLTPLLARRVLYFFPYGIAFCGRVIIPVNRHLDTHSCCEWFVFCHPLFFGAIVNFCQCPPIKSRPLKNKSISTSQEASWVVRILIEALLYCFFILNVNCLSFAREETPQVFTHSSVRNCRTYFAAMRHWTFYFFSSNLCIRGRQKKLKYYYCSI